MLGRLAAVGLIACVSIAPTPVPAPSSPQAAAARHFAAIKNDPLKLLAFLREMPKGGDLHNHLSGAVYAETYLRWAAEDHLCLAIATLSIVSGTCDEAAGRPPAASILENAALYNQAIDAMSMRNWNPALNGRDHFFGAFARFGPASTKTGDMLAEVAARAAAEHVSYLELMLTPDGGAAAAAGRAAGWDEDLGRLREKLLAAGLRDRVVGAVRQRLDAAEARRRELLRCGTSKADAGCAVVVRYLAQVGRTAAPEIVFAQMLAWFELAGVEPRVVGLNLVQPEDAPRAVRDFDLQMSMLDFLHGLYPNVAIALHAGELSAALVHPDTLRTHIRQSIERGHARRIGHAASIIEEDHPYALLREMASKKILVEIALSSNDLILGVGHRHPLHLFLEYGIPVAIATDDMGVARSTHTREFAKAVEQHGVGYLTLKQMARNSIDYAFADAATRTRLGRELEAAFRAFELMVSRQPSPAAQPRR